MPVHVFPSASVSSVEVAAPSAKKISEKSSASFGELMAQHVAEAAQKAAKPDPMQVAAGKTPDVPAVKPAPAATSAPVVKTAAPAAALRAATGKTLAEQASEEPQPSLVNPAFTAAPESKESESSSAKDGTHGGETRTGHEKDAAVPVHPDDVALNPVGSAITAQASASVSMPTAASVHVPEAMVAAQPAASTSSAKPVARPMSGVAPANPAKTSEEVSVSAVKSSTDSSVALAAALPVSLQATEKSTVTVTSKSVAVSRQTAGSSAGAATSSTLSPEQNLHAEDASATLPSDTSMAASGSDAKAMKSAAESAAQKQAVSKSVQVPASGERSSIAIAPQAPAAGTAISSSSAGAAVVERLGGVHEAAPVAANPYQRLDQTGLSGSPVVLHANANRISVGIHDPSLGWVEVKTQSVAGQVSASLVASTSQTHESLTAQLPSLTQFLSDRSVTVGSVTVQQGSTGGEMSSGSGQRQGQGANQQSSGAPAAETPVSLVETSDVVPEERMLSYISVRA